MVSRKHNFLIAAILAVCVLVGALFSVRVSAVSAPSLFHNDERWYKDSTACLEIIDGLFYIPIDIFGMYSHIELSMDSRRGEFMLYNRTSGQYISVLYNEKIATVNGTEEIYLNLYKLHGGYYYVPAEYFCSVLGFTCESRISSAEGMGKTVRINDGTASKTMEELLSVYDPVRDTSDTSAPPATNPPVTDPPVTSDVDTVERIIYLTFNTIREKNTPSILQSLEKTAVHATFFLTDAELKAFPSLVNDILLGGHSLALTAQKIDDAADFIRQMDEANERLYGITKTKTRIVQLPGGTYASGLTEADVQTILAAGYVLWDYTYDVPDSLGYASSAVRDYTLEAIRKAHINVLRLSTNETVVRILPHLLGQFQKAANYHTEPILATGREVRHAARS